MNQNAVKIKSNNNVLEEFKRNHCLKSNVLYMGFVRELCHSSVCPSGWLSAFHPLSVHLSVIFVIALICCPCSRLRSSSCFCLPNAGIASVHHYKLSFILKEKNCKKLLRDAESKKLKEHTHCHPVSQSALAACLEVALLGINMYIHIHVCM